MNIEICYSLFTGFSADYLSRGPTPRTRIGSARPRCTLSSYGQVKMGTSTRRGLASRVATCVYGAGLLCHPCLPGLALGPVGPPPHARLCCSLRRSNRVALRAYFAIQRPAHGDTRFHVAPRMQRAASSLPAAFAKRRRTNCTRNGALPPRQRHRHAGHRPTTTAPR